MTTELKHCRTENLRLNIVIKEREDDMKMVTSTKDDTGIPLKKMLLEFERNFNELEERGEVKKENTDMIKQLLGTVDEV